MGLSRPGYNVLQNRSVTQLSRRFEQKINLQASNPTIGIEIQSAYKDGGQLNSGERYSSQVGSLDTRHTKRNSNMTKTSLKYSNARKNQKPSSKSPANHLRNPNNTVARS
jgi:hypothetical protein